jgi:hypothetical protein
MSAREVPSIILFVEFFFHLFIFQTLELLPMPGFRELKLEILGLSNKSSGSTSLLKIYTISKKNVVHAINLMK